MQEQSSTLNMLVNRQGKAGKAASKRTTRGITDAIRDDVYHNPFTAVWSSTKATLAELKNLGFVCDGVDGKVIIAQHSAAIKKAYKNALTSLRTSLGKAAGVRSSVEELEANFPDIKSVEAIVAKAWSELQRRDDDSSEKVTAGAVFYAVLRVRLSIFPALGDLPARGTRRKSPMPH